jgi:hypothetical protein
MQAAPAAAALQGPLREEPLLYFLLCVRENISVHVAGTPLRQVMAENQPAHNTRIVWLSGDGQEEQVSVQFTDLPLIEGSSAFSNKKTSSFLRAELNRGTGNTNLDLI